jgi:hypothetical protein
LQSSFDTIYNNVLMTKHQQYFQDMLENHKELFDAFKKIHDQYALEPEKWQKEFNEKGEEIMGLIRRYENLLCGKSEGTGYGRYSSKLADKFMESVRKTFPKIDFVGMK